MQFFALGGFAVSLGNFAESYYLPTGFGSFHFV